MQCVFSDNNSINKLLGMDGNGHIYVLRQQLWRQMTWSNACKDEWWFSIRF